jgi:hypothetical protein
VYYGCTQDIAEDTDTGGDTRCSDYQKQMEDYFTRANYFPKNERPEGTHCYIKYRPDLRYNNITGQTDNWGTIFETYFGADDYHEFTAGTKVKFAPQRLIGKKTTNQNTGFTTLEVIETNEALNNQPALYSASVVMPIQVPPGLEPGKEYFVITNDLTLTEFKLSETQGGVPIILPPPGNSENYEFELPEDIDELKPIQTHVPALVYTHEMSTGPYFKIENDVKVRNSFENNGSKLNWFFTYDNAQTATAYSKAQGGMGSPSVLSTKTAYVSENDYPIVRCAATVTVRDPDGNIRLVEAYSRPILWYDIARDTIWRGGDYRLLSSGNGSVGSFAVEPLLAANCEPMTPLITPLPADSDSKQPLSCESKGIGVVQPQSGLDYPFVGPRADNEIESGIKNLFADFYLSYESLRDPTGPQITFQRPFRIYWLYGFGCDPDYSIGAEPLAGIEEPAPEHDADLVVIDANNNIVFDSTKAAVFSAQEWGECYKIYEWRRLDRPLAGEEDAGEPVESICRVVTYDVQSPDIGDVTKPERYYPANAILDERTIYAAPKRVLSLRVQNGECVTPRFKNKISFVNGKNTEIEQAETTVADLRRITDITFNAEPGSGKGQYGLCGSGICDENTPTNVCPPGDDQQIKICYDTELPGETIKNINGVTPDDAGNIFISAADCLWARKPVKYTDDNSGGFIGHNYADVKGEPTRAVIAVGADCAPCCACEDYLETAKYLSKVGKYYQTIGSRVDEVKEIHEDNISRWKDQSDCRKKQQFEIMLVPQPCPCIDVVVVYCQKCPACTRNITLTINFKANGSVNNTAGTINKKFSKLVLNGKSKAIQIKGEWPTYTAEIPDSLDAGSSFFVQFRLCFCPASDFRIYADVTGTANIGTETGPPAAITVDCENVSAPIAKAKATATLDCSNNS